MKKKIIPVVIIAAVLCLLGFAGFNIWQYNLAYHEVNVEAGINLTPQMLMSNGDATAEFEAGSTVLNNRVPGDYNLVVKTSKYRHKVLVHITDSIAPTAEAVDVRVDFGQTASPEEFVKNISDATEVSVAYEQEPDFSQDGTQDVTVVLTDLGGNTAKYSAKLTVTFIKSLVVVEAGAEAPKAEEFLLGDCNATFLTDLSAIDYNITGDNEVDIDIDGTVYTGILRIEDTVAPSFEVNNVNGFANSKMSIDRFVVFVDDISDVTYYYEQEPDFSKAGDQQVVLSAKDSSGNITTASATLSLQEDNEAPVISGLKDFVSYSGHAIAFKDGITVTDNNPENLTLNVDTGNLDISVPGSYTVVYTATDASGNSTQESIVVTIKGKEYTDEFVNELADAALAKILKPNMSQREIITAIFKYVRKNLSFYTGHSIKLFWQQGAVDAFVDGIGDCYMYCCMSRALLTRAGIQNLEITRSVGARPTSHYWNLVYIDGEGWYHFDSLTMKDGTQFLLWTDAMIKEYDETHPGYHTYDADLYPVIN